EIYLFVRDLLGNDLLSRTRGSDLYTITLQDLVSPTPAWLWHRRLYHLNFNTINLLSKNDILNGLPKLKFVKEKLCSSCELGKANRIYFKTIAVTRSKKWLDLLHMDLYGLMRVESINGKKYILNLQAQMITVRTDRGTEFLNKTLHAYFKEKGIEYQTSTPRTPKQNGIVERQNCTLVEASRMMLFASKLALFFWAEAITTACNGYSLKDKNEAKKDKTEHETGKSMRKQIQRRIHF
ncbi:retrovirus-related pol polyprotein from transposon TNT 1-94, partial [Tanacetum coccineum]